MTASRSRRTVRATGRPTKLDEQPAIVCQDLTDYDRFVQLPGTAQFDEELIPLVKAVHQDPASAGSGAFIIEFHDAVGAALYRSRLMKDSNGNVKQEANLLPPPGLVSPPGLEAPPVNDVTCTLPAVPAPVSKPAGHEVVLTGIPNEICNNAMMEVVLEQAGLEESLVGEIRATKGQQSGDVRFFLCTLQAAQMCQKHFSGSRWSNNVSAHIVAAPAQTPSTATSQMSCDAPVFLPQEVSQFSVNAPDFLPSGLCRVSSWTRNASDTSTEAATESDEELSDGPR